MQSQYENRYMVTRNILEEYVKKCICRGQRIYAAIQTGVCATFFVVLAILGEGPLVFLIGVCGLFTLFVYFYYKIIVRLMIKNSVKVHGGFMPETVYILSDKIYLTEGTIRAEFNYSQIETIYELKQTYALMIGKRNAVLLKKDAFIAGTPEDFSAFIRDKCPKSRYILRG